MTEYHIQLWKKWVTVPQVKEAWFIEGYETSDYIYGNIKGDGHTMPFIIYLNDMPIGYIQYYDLSTYRRLTPKPKGLFTNESEGAFCIDLFIAENDLLK